MLEPSSISFIKLLEDTFLTTLKYPGEIWGSHIGSLLNVALCSLVDINQRFRGVYCLHYQGSSW
jgi:hypothetical protein